ncbi:hypothetical protein NC653_024712 [Populus alba x Populus x berolinensis]|uniref:Uncharacterized protein n=1 Tax=Populus alba x Populus x berolinensis TaxID=444605 RepID=A0AAD6M9F9_9ROSI|nr:hypothetical protein NC653_024712 [Populus alba x Populus x berolinensis]
MSLAIKIRNEWVPLLAFKTLKLISLVINLGEIPSSLEFRSGAWVDLSSNFLEGSLPIWYNVSVLNLKSNLLPGPISLNFCQEMSSLTGLNLSGNSLNGNIPPFITSLKNLGTLGSFK